MALEVLGSAVAAAVAAAVQLLEEAESVLGADFRLEDFEPGLEVVKTSSQIKKSN